MSTSTTAGGGGGSAGGQRELVFCHRCHDEWYRDDHGLECPICGSDFVEIMEDHGADPMNRPPRIPGGFDDAYDSSGDEAEHNHTSYSTSFLFEGPGIRIQRSTGNPLPGVGMASTRAGGASTGESGQPGGIAGPNMVEMLQTIFASIMGEQGVERARQQAQGESGVGTGAEATHGAAGGDYAPQDPRTRGNAPSLPNLFGGMQPPVGSRFVYERHTIPPRAGAVPLDDLVDDLPSFLQQLFGGVNSINDPSAGMMHRILGMPGGPGGDYVWTEGQLDRVISELMEQHQGNAPPPAPPEVLNNLPKIKVDQKRVLEGEDCAVCKEDLILDEEVAQLPCRHVYHEDCIRRWLESRDTCPICRASTAAAMRGQQGQTQSGSQQNQQQDSGRQQQSQQQQQQQGSPTQTRRTWGSFFGGQHRTTTTTNSNTNVNNNSGNPSSTNPSGSNVHWSWTSSGGNNTGNPR